MTGLLRRISWYLDDHWILKWFVVPILFMASILFVIGLLTTATAVESTQLAGLFVGFSLAVVAVGLLLDRAVGYVAGWELLESRRNRGR